MEIYNTAGTCSRQIIFRVDGENRVSDVKFIGGCSGNLQGIAKLVDGQNIDDVIAKLKGIICRSGTSCPDQLARALIKYKEKRAGDNSQAAK
ncbi:MAG TPA: TIGR03905 family TSCPD domain-containing protein [Firmicutes bacterium]|jgi:uncharacterized protein TIGR03905|nr:TIGR03905 family TSCPD domain-containing protein [Bacillota bacterium]